MKNFFKLAGIIAATAVIGVSMVACDNGGGSSGGDGNNNGSNYICQLSTGSCIPTVSISDCLQAGGSVVDVCQGQPISSSSSSDTPSGGASSSSQNAQISSSSGSTNPSTNTSLNGVWKAGITQDITISGNSGILSSYTGTDAVWLSALDKGYITVGSSQYFRNITSTGTLTWSGQELYVQSYTSSPNVAIGTSWHDITITMSTDGQTITITRDNNTTYTLTRITYSLNGVWKAGITQDITVSGNSGILSSYTGTDAVWLSAIDKGYITVGSSQYFRNITSTGTLTWSGQELYVQSYTSSPNVAIGTSWHNITITMSTDGQTITITRDNNTTYTLTRR